MIVLTQFCVVQYDATLCCFSYYLLVVSFFSFYLSFVQVSNRSHGIWHVDVCGTVLVRLTGHCTPLGRTWYRQDAPLVATTVGNYVDHSASSSRCVVSPGGCVAIVGNRLRCLSD